MISVLYFIRKINAEKIKKTNNIRNNGTKKLEWIVEVPENLILAGWCNVFHQSTEYLIIGIFIEPIIENNVANFKLLSIGDINFKDKIIKT